MSENIHVVNCDFCHEDMDIDETGYHILEENKGGHILCAVNYMQQLPISKKRTP